MKQILVFIFDGYADWEPAYVCAPVSYTHLTLPTIRLV